MNCTPIFPFTKSYALGSLIKHKPWSIKNKLKFTYNKTAKDQFELFIKSKICPQILHSEIIQLQTNYNNRINFKNPNNSYIDENNVSNEIIDQHEDEYNANYLSSVMHSFARTMNIMENILIEVYTMIGQRDDQQEIQIWKVKIGYIIRLKI